MNTGTTLKTQWLNLMIHGLNSEQFPLELLLAEDTIPTKTLVKKVDYIDYIKRKSKLLLHF